MICDLCLRAPRSRLRALGTVLVVAFSLLLLTSAPASAHGLSSVVYADLSSPERGVVTVHLGLEYDLFEVSVADSEHDDALYRQGQPAWENGDFPAMTQAMNDHRMTTGHYIAGHFVISGSGRRCSSGTPGDAQVRLRQGVPYVFFDVNYTCDHGAIVHDFSTTFFGAGEGYVKGTTTIATYDLDGHHGSAALGLGQTSFSTQQGFWDRFGQFYRLGTHHLLTGLDHLLFLSALIVGSRRLREVVLSATTFTVAHMVTLGLTALGIVHVPESVVEPLIALSIAGVAAWALYRLWTKGEKANQLDTVEASGPWRHVVLDRTGYLRLGVVFFFGLVHGMGFASALGIDNPWSWTLLWSLLVFSLGIETVQLGLILLLFPVLALVRRRSTRHSMWVTGLVAASVSVVGLVWFVQRVVAVAHGETLT